MALLKCSECNHDVSEYAKICPNCGCPVEIIKQHLDNSIENKDKKMYTIINGQKKDVTYFVNTILSEAYEKEEIDLKEFRNKLLNELDVYPEDFVCEVYECNGAPKEINCESAKKRLEKWEYAYNKQAAINASKPKCPHCQSTNISKISGTERAASVIGLGILSNKINKSFKCKSCGYTW